MKLSEHFTLEEMTISQTAVRRNIPNAPCGVTVNNLMRLCALLEEIRVLLGRPINISSGYRSPAVNDAVGGSKNSQHILGCAADFTAKGLFIRDTVEAIMRSNISYDQLISEYDKWVHVSVPSLAQGIPRKQTLIIDHKGTRQYEIS